jgi:superfamily II DNA or RNA helicase
MGGASISKGLPFWRRQDYHGRPSHHKELLIRGDLHRCMIVCPGNLSEQWQDELYQRFQLDFKILTNDALESARTGNWFAETPLAICRLDKLSRNEDVQAKLANTDWDLVVCDEAHNMSATFFGNEVKYTKSYRLGQLLGQITRHLLLMTATPHNGKQEDFQLFMALLDSDRFEGRTRDGVHTIESFFVAGSGMDELTKSYGVF